MPTREATPAAGGSAGDPDLELDLSKVAGIVREIDPHGNLIAFLQRAQEVYGYLPESVVDEIARISGIRASRIYGIITFYAQFTTVPTGRHKCLVCHGTACHVAGATRITEALSQELSVGDGETRADREFGLDSVACMGACSQAPVMRIDDETYGNLTADETRKIARKLLVAVAAEQEGGPDA